jgi:hypothetical protein
MEEIWKPCPLFPRYLVSNQGRVKFEKTGKLRKLQKTTRHEGKYYYFVAIGIGGKKNKGFTVHRLVALTFLDNPNDLPFVNHKDGNKLNNHVDNLEWCTRYENEQHAFATGLKNSSGEKNVAAKLKEEHIPIIRSLMEFGVRDEAIAYGFGVNRATINRIRNGKIWAHAA